MLKETPVKHMYLMKCKINMHLTVVSYLPLQCLSELGHQGQRQVLN